MLWHIQSRTEIDLVFFKSEKTELNCRLSVPQWVKDFVEARHDEEEQINEVGRSVILPKRIGKVLTTFAFLLLLAIFQNLARILCL